MYMKVKEYRNLSENLVFVRISEAKRYSNLPISAKNTQALIDVEAFTLMADDFKHVLSLKTFRSGCSFVTIILIF